ncbi:MAG: hypothetical protein WBF81_08035 [Thermoplasmata archaeon]
MEHGYIEGEASFAPATRVWRPDAPAATSPTYVSGAELAPLPFGRFSASPRFPALHSPSCHLVEVEYN